ncbi:CHASE2 domain-containing protein [Hahella sp. KA22]|uniref:CHASE2 domain-containing protein n=1 Tax=Hahella sp. KA22 TaxID=1628392 RepID=UPI000FDE2751|nr:adenylate/guanylate cyclase domain-containing protein [Hahella sp. KA22]AZZ91618.1 adenylate/guanylate cyclase domain-containing protein [Hahella sp. KA22]QAY54988.1 CHASE2 domain-containing protein [Hahella sp. KA22]
MRTISGFLKHLPALLIAVAMIGWQLITPSGDRSLLNRLDYVFYDWRAQTAAHFTRTELYTDVVIVDIDEESIQREGRWPWSRARVAALVEALQESGAAVVAFDVVFSESESNNFIESVAASAGPDLSDEERAVLNRIAMSWRPDEQLAERLSEIDTVLGFFMHLDTSMQIGRLPDPLAAAPAGNVLINASGYAAPLLELQDVATGSGFVTTFPDADGVIRRTPLFMSHDGSVYPSLALASAMTYLLADEVELEFAPLGAVQAASGMRLTDALVQTDAVGQVLVPYRQGRGQFRYIPAWITLAGGLASQELEGKLVFVGTSAIGLADLVSTPFATVFPGVEVQALVAQGLLQGGFPYRPVWEPGAVLVFQLALLLLLVWVLPGRRPLTMVLAAIMISLLLVALNTLIWTRWRMDFPMISTLLLEQGVFGWYLVTEFIHEYAVERRVRGMFAQYVPPAHIDRMLDNPEQYSMAGESKELTVLFSDIRSFTTISEQLSAAQLKELLNLYFTPITESIFRNDGTIDKYVGDMVMAFWGAPVDDPEHAEKAVKTALEMQAITRRLSSELTAKGFPAIQIGVGINTGLMNVGDMGSQYRKAYTVLGDAVNLGSRLEGLTKFYGVDVLVGETTVKAADGYVFRFCDRIQVKGKDIPVDAYEPLGEKGRLDAVAMNRLTRYQRAIESYRARQWEQADAIFQQLQIEEPGCRLYDLYRERINGLREQTLPEDWDGVYRHTSK